MPSLALSQYQGTTLSTAKSWRNHCIAHGIVRSSLAYKCARGHLSKKHNRSEADRNYRSRSLQILSRFSGRSPEHTNKYHKLGQYKNDQKVNFLQFSPNNLKYSKHHNFLKTSPKQLKFSHNIHNIHNFNTCARIHEQLKTLDASRSATFQVSLSVFRAEKRVG